MVNNALCLNGIVVADAAGRRWNRKPGMACIRSGYTGIHSRKGGLSGIIVECEWEGCGGVGTGRDDGNRVRDRFKCDPLS